MVEALSKYAKFDEFEPLRKIGNSERMAWASKEPVDGPCDVSGEGVICCDRSFPIGSRFSRTKKKGEVHTQLTQTPCAFTTPPIFYVCGCAVSPPLLCFNPLLRLVVLLALDVPPSF